MTTDTIQLAILGLGTVGTGCLSLLDYNQLMLARQCGANLKVTKALVSDLHKPRSPLVAGVRCFTEIDAIIDDPDIAVVIECIGGIQPARQYIEAALAAGKAVVTANKALLAAHGAELMACARTHQVPLRFEAAVAGGIPIIKTLAEGLAANRVFSIKGIINGTSNFILSQMTQQQVEFAAALKQAQSAGYAEADPHFDINGIDAAQKLTILAAMTFGLAWINISVATEGIVHISAFDIAMAKEWGYHIKPLAIAEAEANGVRLCVHPCFVSQSHILSHVDGIMNAVLIDSDALGESLYYGPGAGGTATASAILADVVDTLTHPNCPLPWVTADAAHAPELLPIDDRQSACYLRVWVQDKPGVLAEITRVLSEFGINIEKVIQRPTAANETRIPIALLTREACDSDITAAIAVIEQLSEVLVPVLRVRVASFS